MPRVRQRLPGGGRGGEGGGQGARFRRAAAGRCQAREPRPAAPRAGPPASSPRHARLHPPFQRAAPCTHRQCAQCPATARRRGCCGRQTRRPRQPRLLAGQRWAGAGRGGRPIGAQAGGCAGGCGCGGCGGSSSSSSSSSTAGSSGLRQQQSLLLEQLQQQRQQRLGNHRSQPATPPHTRTTARPPRTHPARPCSSTGTGGSPAQTSGAARCRRSGPQTGATGRRGAGPAARTGPARRSRPTTAWRPRPPAAPRPRTSRRRSACKEGKKQARMGGVRSCAGTPRRR